MLFIFKAIFFNILLQHHKCYFCYRQRAKDLEEELERTIRSYQNQVCALCYVASVPNRMDATALKYHFQLGCATSSGFLTSLRHLFWLTQFLSRDHYVTL